MSASHLEHQLVMEMRNFQFLQASSSFVGIPAFQILFQQLLNLNRIKDSDIVGRIIMKATYLVDQITNRFRWTADTPNRIQAMLIRNHCLAMFDCLAKSRTRVNMEERK